MKELIKGGGIVKHRGKNGKISIPVPKIEEPHIVYGDNDEGVGRGPGKPGDVIGREPKEGGESGNQAGNDPGEGQIINVDMEDILKLLQEDLKLPDLKPKPSETFEEIKIKYNNISKNGPNSLRHMRRTMKEAMKRIAASGDIDKKVFVPGLADPIRLISPLNSDFRYRQYAEVKIPSSNAVVFFARDWSGSMDQYRCDIVSDMSWWMDLWIRKFYKRVERVYVGHDTVAEECSEEKFYKYRMGGGTNCSSAMKLITSMFENRYKPETWNIYVFYFTDGDNWEQDNTEMMKVMKEHFKTDIVNLVGITQVLSWRYENSVKARIDQELESGNLPKGLIKTTSIGSADSVNASGSHGWTNPSNLSDEERNSQIMRAIKDIMSDSQSSGKKVA